MENGTRAAGAERNFDSAVSYRYNTGIGETKPINIITYCNNGINDNNAFYHAAVSQSQWRALVPGGR